jgi:hypothetical protein
VKIWKVILATVVIFAAGVLAGGLVMKQILPKPQPPKPPVPGILSQQRFQSRLKEKLHLTPEQTNRIDRIFAESNERVRILWGLIGPELQKELQAVRESIRAELTPEQKEKFEHLLKRPERPEKSEARHGRAGTNRSDSPAPAR